MGWALRRISRGRFSRLKGYIYIYIYIYIYNPAEVNG